ncbi:phospholipase D family protein [Geomonas oryzae]|uniref:phospholipase D family protein n=1 Tax=Geomonas oryzae TaxID=2364273 RepID=UPI00100B8655|nr:phospholipase D family protein [Geomonas oryzae]
MAILATYSADLVAVTAALMAAAGVNVDDKGQKLSSLRFARSYEELRGKFHVISQSGRISLPRSGGPLLSLLDRMMVQVDCDEEKRSWHPKFTVARHVSDDKARKVEWRVWIGSRNLTRDISWDSGLVITGEKGKAGNSIPGLVETICFFMEKARIDAKKVNQLKRELGLVNWIVPPRIKVEEVCLLGPDLRSYFPEVPDGLKEVVVVSPFLDRGIVNKFGTWGGGGVKRWILSTRPAFAKLVRSHGGSLNAFSAGYLGSPESSEDTSFDTVDSDDEVLESRGLHAKLIYARHAKGESLWMGSANATSRGWGGRNFEVVVKLSATAGIGAGIHALVGLSTPIKDAEIVDPPDSDPIEEELKVARNQVAARWRLVHEMFEKGNRLSGNVAPHPDNENIQLEVAQLSTEYVTWLRNTKELILAPVPLYAQTEFVKVRLSLLGKHLEWVQLTPFKAPLGEERDQQAIARLLSPKAFLEWIRAILEGQETHFEDEDQNFGPKRGGNDYTSNHDSFQIWAPTLEMVLSAWSRNPGVLNSVQERVSKYLPSMLARLAEHPVSKDESRAIKEFIEAWEIVQQVLTK